MFVQGKNNGENLIFTHSKRELAADYSCPSGLVSNNVASPLPLNHLLHFVARKKKWASDRVHVLCMQTRTKTGRSFSFFLKIFLFQVEGPLLHQTQDFATACIGAPTGRNASLRLTGGAQTSAGVRKRDGDSRQGAIIVWAWAKNKIK